MSKPKDCIYSQLGKGSGPDDLAFALYTTSRAFSGIYREYLDPYGLTYPQYLVMLVLWEEKRLGLKEIAMRLCTTSHALSPICKRLESAGLVTRERDISDDRLLFVRLTDLGHALRATICEVPIAVSEAIGMTTRDRLELLERLVSLREILGEAT